ncbi:MAG: hypothetical protein OEZ68_07765 [Gammaproteobacteria bacterium]|nr:hypothetical protein [Gammaproteobacteria bacterium]MDH5800682.1 hypothetical protein [Gammaproteobacteria bacterium]
MSGLEWLMWLRGPGLKWALVIFLAGLVYRVIRIISSGKSRDLSVPRQPYLMQGLLCIVRRSIFHPGMTHRGYFTLISGYTFHIGLLLAVFFLQQHILVFKSILHVSWPALPPFAVDVATLVSITALFAILIHRILDPVVRALTNYQDILAWILTVLPLLTGFALMHPMGISYTAAMVLHLASVEMLLVVIPFTKLTHMVTLFVSRWYNGALGGYRGVKT